MNSYCPPPDTYAVNDQSGATGFEYGLVAAVASLAVSAIIPILTTNLNQPFS
jgi:Flp pilus assembly pilin Flp